MNQLNKAEEYFKGYGSPYDELVISLINTKRNIERLIEKETSINMMSLLEDDTLNMDEIASRMDLMRKISTLL